MLMSDLTVTENRQKLFTNGLGLPKRIDLF